MPPCFTFPVDLAPLSHCKARIRPRIKPNSLLYCKCFFFIYYKQFVLIIVCFEIYQVTVLYIGRSIYPVSSSILAFLMSIKRSASQTLLLLVPNFTTCSTACTVDFSSLKPNCKSDRPFLSATFYRSLLPRRSSRNLPITSSRQVDI